MKKKSRIPIKISDNVQIISGFYKDENGEVLDINRKTGRLFVKGINFKFKHVKPSSKNQVGEIKQFEAPIHHSNVKLKSKETR